MTEHNEQQLVDRGVSRRNILKALGIGGGVAALGFANLFGESDTAFAQTQGDSIQTILNFAATAEALAITHFHAAVTTSPFFAGLPEVYKGYLRAAITQEQAHFDFLVANGAKPLATKFYVPDGYLSNLALYVAVTDIAESAFIGAYLASIRRFSELDQHLLAEVSGQVLGVEAEHRALNRAMGIVVLGNTGLASNIALQRPTLFQVSQAGPILAPFLQGGEGLGLNFVGPFDQPARAAALQAGAQLDPVPTAISAFGRKATKKTRK
jgi:hypothetical protein